MSRLFELLGEHAKKVGAGCYPTFILNDGIEVTGEFEKDINGDIKRVGFAVKFNGLSEDEMPEVIVGSVMRHFERLGKKACGPHTGGAPI